MPAYKYKGDRPVDVPEFGLVGVQPGEVVTVDGEIRHSDFALQAKAGDKKATGGGAEEE